MNRILDLEYLSNSNDLKCDVCKKIGDSTLYSVITTKKNYNICLCYYHSRIYRIFFMTNLSNLIIKLENKGVRILKNSHITLRKQ